MASSMVVDNGKKIMLDRTYNAVPTRSVPSQFKIGVGTTGASTSDTGLEHAIPFSGTETVDDCETADWTDSADMTTSLNSTTYKVGSNSLNLTKDGGASATAYTYKTTTSLNFTSKELSLWIYIKDATALAKLAASSCLTIRFGSDDSNYYQWTKDLTALAVGWNLVDGLTSATATTTGSPAIAACDYTYIALTATAAGITWSAGDMAMDDIKLISTDDYLKAFEASYPQLDYTNIQATIRTRVTTLQANGYPVSETGIFNSDSPPLMESRDTFTPISKSTTDELIFIHKNQIL